MSNKTPFHQCRTVLSPFHATARKPQIMVIRF